jgi:RHH-type transcriptional regulator, rel operon repressor / antitoxin RelB
MLTVRLPPSLEKRLHAVARKTGKTKTAYARDAILKQIEDIEDYYLAWGRLAGRESRETLEGLERRLKKRANP